MAFLALCPATALAQTVFYDDFGGNALLPHWGLPPPAHWEYNVSNSMLNVTRLLSPSHFKSPTNFSIMGAPFEPQTDFQLDARMGWGASEGVARFDLTVRINSGLVATIGYCELLCGATGIFAGTSAGVVFIPSPPPGIYDFRITRVGAQFDFYFEGNRFASLPSAYRGPLNGLSFFFSSPYPGQSGPFHIDRVQVVPAPGTLLVPAVGLGWLCRRKRRLSART